MNTTLLAPHPGVPDPDVLAQTLHAASQHHWGTAEPWHDADQPYWRQLVAKLVAVEGTEQRTSGPGRLVGNICQQVMMQTAAGYYWRALPYHNWGHVQAVFSAYRLLWGEPHSEVAVAIAWHDAIHVPGALPGVNEDLSAAALDWEWRQRFGSSEAIDIEFSKELVRATRVENHIAPSYKPASIYEARLLDCDLAGFGRPWTRFLIDRLHIIQEYMPSSELQTADDQMRALSLQAEFLNHFLDDERGYIYHTREAREAWEEQARTNIQRLADENRPGHPL